MFHADVLLIDDLEFGDSFYRMFSRVDRMSNKRSSHYCEGGVLRYQREPAWPGIMRVAMSCTFL